MKLIYLIAILMVMAGCNTAEGDPDSSASVGETDSVQEDLACEAPSLKDDNELVVSVEGEERTVEGNTFDFEFGGHVHVLPGYETNTYTGTVMRGEDELHYPGVTIRAEVEDKTDRDEEPAATIGIYEMPSWEPATIYDITNDLRMFKQLQPATVELQIDDYPELCFFDLIYSAENEENNSLHYFLGKAINEKVYVVQLNVTDKDDKESEAEVLAMASTIFIEKTMEDRKPMVVTQSCEAGVNLSLTLSERMGYNTSNDGEIIQEQYRHLFYYTDTYLREILSVSCEGEATEENIASIIASHEGMNPDFEFIDTSTIEDIEDVHMYITYETSTNELRNTVLLERDNVLIKARFGINLSRDYEVRIKEFHEAINSIDVEYRSESEGLFEVENEEGTSEYRLNHPSEEMITLGNFYGRASDNTIKTDDVYGEIAEFIFNPNLEDIVSELKEGDTIMISYFKDEHTGEKLITRIDKM
ncbi:hypothetical protein [Evansella cellulosilytica]|uniref:Uncharacterized protein n=1 Tax=Evansella cellulosilytica (strain ATCC 21833 / DSM 2522 / FERM P-1141 / JCM 9156 / N-4) TaxID=649639 RepID=E6U1Z9_EVAC2|nr:hypothetical protein [Evansella cellulosilytica]ADU29243.1 hypothetical protein Bcell_0970 [Evansella cellulosilytica DSM 2522]